MGDNVEDRSCTNPIKWSMHLLAFVSELCAMSDLLSQLLSEQCDNEQSLEILLK